MDSSTQPTFQLHTHPLIHFSTTYSSTHPLVQLHTHPLIHFDSSTHPLLDYILIHSSTTHPFEDFRKTVSFVSTLVAKVRKCKISRFIPAAKYSSTHPYWLLHTQPLIHSTIGSTTYSSTQPLPQLHTHPLNHRSNYMFTKTLNHSSTQPLIQLHTQPLNHESMDSTIQCRA